MKRALFALGALAIAVSCGPDNSLGGSVSELFPLTVSRVDILRNADAFQVSYYNNRGADVDLVARLTVALTGFDFKSDKTYKLAGEYVADHQRATVVHLGGGEPGRVLPHVRNGELKLSSGGNPGETTRGSFSVSFEQTDGYGGGRTLDGRFLGEAQDAGFGEDGNQTGVDAGT